MAKAGEELIEGSPMAKHKEDGGLSPYGNLELSAVDPANIKLFNDNQFGRVYTVKTNKDRKYYLYGKPVTKKQNDIAQVKNPQPYTKDNPYPATIDNINIQSELSPGQHVIAKVVEGKGFDHLYEVVTFNPLGDVRSDMPESGNGIKITGQGYVLKEYLIKNRDLKEKFKPFSGPIFLHENLIADVRQNTFGDCFLLASILSILRAPGGNEFIRGMMRQEGNRTIVRLFDPEEKIPVYISVENSNFYVNKENNVTHGAPWVHILEKAYAAFARKKEGKNYFYAHPSFHEMYGNGGLPETALKILTGCAVEEVALIEPPKHPWNSERLVTCKQIYERVMHMMDRLSSEEMNDLDVYFNDQTNSTSLKSLLTLLENHIRSRAENPIGVFEELMDRLGENGNKKVIQILSKFKDNPADFLTAFNHYLNYVKLLTSDESPFERINENAISSSSSSASGSRSAQKIGKLGLVGKYILQVLSDPKADAWLNLSTHLDNTRWTDTEVRQAIEEISPKPSPEVLEILRTYANYEIVFLRQWPGEVGEGRYDKFMQAAYHSINLLLSQNHSIVTQTRTQFEEGTVPGLRIRHAYAVVGTEEKKGVLWVKVRNPWAKVGRMLELSKVQRRTCAQEAFAREDEEQPEFLVELSEFGKYFEKYTVGKFAPVIQADLVPSVSPKVEKIPGLEPLKFISGDEKNINREREKRINKINSMFLGASAVSGLLGGFLTGFLGAPFTFGLSLPFCMVAGLIIGLVVGLAPIVARFVSHKTTRTSINDEPNDNVPPPKPKSKNQRRVQFADSAQLKEALQQQKGKTPVQSISPDSYDPTTYSLVHKGSLHLRKLPNTRKSPQLPGIDPLSTVRPGNGKKNQ